MKLNFCLLECGLDLVTHFWDIEYSRKYKMSLLRSGYKKTEASVSNVLSLSLSPSLLQVPIYCKLFSGETNMVRNRGRTPAD